ncbi:MAG: UDP-N-acetylglucosamine diphosphorylase/glucosamine-1-phosphate N-acetyltransferase [Chloroflexi bacterium]|nr:MAG: UDP-N-acetylglucosamine diphosphorylase/glucosamine-1-phosphate N-acetyltransferase [Chloroflexota bacterium]
MSRSPLGIVLAAGLGTRMRSQTPKVMHSAAGRPLLAWILGTLAEVGARPVVVLSKESEPARALLNGEATFAMQDPPRGTGDAVRVALESVKDARGEALIVYGDTPLVRADTLRALIALRTERSAVLAILSGEVGADNAYGRIVRNASGDVARIVEARLATTTEKALAESNLGAYAADLEWLRGAVTRLRANETGEIFLTDLVALAVGDGRRVAAHLVADPQEGRGVNTRVELATAEQALYQRIRERHMLAGVTFHDPASSFVGADVELAPDVVIERGSLLEGKTRVGSGTRIGPYSVLRDTTVGENCKAEMSVLEGATLEDDCRIGPFGHLRPGAYLERGVEMGNYGEVKAARLGAGTKMHHFGYVGDASVGKRVNIGAGTITMNYTAKRTKERTEIGDDAFIGSDSLLRAPVRVGNRSITGGGSVVTKDVPDDTVAVGVPARAIKKNQPKQKA